MPRQEKQQAPSSVLFATTGSLLYHPPYLPRRIIPSERTAVIRQSDLLEVFRYCRAAFERSRCEEQAFAFACRPDDATRSGSLPPHRLAAIALSSLVMIVVGCKGPDLYPANTGMGGALAPTTVRQYGQQRGISDEQARSELRQKVSQHDEEQAIENIDQAGAKLR